MVLCGSNDGQFANTLCCLENIPRMPRMGFHDLKLFWR